ncbi:MAG: hypothetical protein WCH34_04275 [Bacteroidota bacterium]
MENNEQAQSPYDKELKRAQWREEMKVKCRTEIENNPNVKKLYEEYRPDSIAYFIDHYVQEKLSVLEHGANYVEWEENAQLEWVDKAFDCLKEIQQKKLFDLQCQWRAEKIQLPGVEICFDLKLWERNIINCPLIPPVSIDELDLYEKYLRSDNYQTIGFYLWEFWQDYDKIIEAANSDEADESFPEWYDFYNQNKGTGVYLLYPNIRGEKEKFYVDLVIKKHQITNKEEIKKQEKLDKETQLKFERNIQLNVFDKDFMKWFIATFEDKLTRENAEFAGAAFKAFDHDDMMEVEELLENIQEAVPIPEGLHWKDALYYTIAIYQKMKTAEALPIAYEKYCMHINASIPFENEFDDFKGQLQSLRTTFANQIIEGRLLNGEPGDLNF